MSLQDDEWMDYEQEMERLGTSETRRKYHHGFGEVTGRVRLGLDFATPEAMVAWLEAMKGRGALPNAATVYVKDALDDSVKRDNSFIVKNEGDRGEQFRLRVETTTNEGI